MSAPIAITHLNIWHFPDLEFNKHGFENLATHQSPALIQPLYRNCQNPSKAVKIYAIYCISKSEVS